MGSERSATIRQRLEGRICAICDARLPPPHVPGERRCNACEPKRRVYMQFMLRAGWHCSFLEADVKTVLPRKITLDDPRKLFEMAERGGFDMSLEGRQAIEHGISIGRGGVWLELTQDQYRKLLLSTGKRPR